MKCPRCEQDNPSHALFCPKCGAPFHRLDGSAKPAPSYEDVQRCLTESLDQQTATSEGSLKVELQKFEARGPSEFEAAFSRMRRGGATECEMSVGTVPATSHRPSPGCVRSPGIDVSPKRIGGLRALCATASLASPAISRPVAA